MTIFRTSAVTRSGRLRACETVVIENPDRLATSRMLAIKWLPAKRTAKRTHKPGNIPYAKRFAKRFTCSIILLFRVSVNVNGLAHERIRRCEPVLQTQTRCHRRLHPLLLKWSLPRFLPARQSRQRFLRRRFCLGTHLHNRLCPL